jgi:SAM-dependent methyltransferase
MTIPSESRLRLRDDYLQTVTRELFDCDVRLRGLCIEARYDRGVAHLTGEVDEPEQLGLCRELIGRLEGVMAVWDRVSVAGQEPMVIDVGCGTTKQYLDSVGLDRLATDAVDVVADVSRSLPFPDASVDRIFAVHILEHLIDFLPLVDECHRVLRPGGVLHVLSPWWRYVNAVADPTHVRLLDVQTFKGICHQPARKREWYPLHAACDGATVFADLMPLDGKRPEASWLARFFE